MRRVCPGEARVLAQEVKYCFAIVLKRDTFSILRML